MTRFTDKQLETIHEGYEAGNYANAYETQDLDVASEQHKLYTKNELYCSGFVLGFYSSYELHEVPCEHRDEIEANRAYLASVLGDDC